MRKYIDADRLLKLLNAWKYPVGKKTIRQATYNSAMNDVRRCIDAIPAADAAEVRHGRWIKDEFGSRCGACGLYAYRDKFDEPWESPYCPNCGARMEVE